MLIVRFGKVGKVARSRFGIGLVFVYRFHDGGKAGFGANGSEFIRKFAHNGRAHHAYILRRRNGHGSHFVFQPVAVYHKAHFLGVVHVAFAEEGALRALKVHVYYARVHAPFAYVHYLGKSGKRNLSALGVVYSRSVFPFRSVEIFALVEIIETFESFVLRPPHYAHILPVVVNGGGGGKSVIAFCNQFVRHFQKLVRGERKLPIVRAERLVQSVGVIADGGYRVVGNHLITVSVVSQQVIAHILVHLVFYGYGFALGYCVIYFVEVFEFARVLRGVHVEKGHNYIVLLLLAV